jgi:hypothetical protein
VDGITRWVSEFVREAISADYFGAARTDCTILLSYLHAFLDVPWRL